MRHVRFASDSNRITDIPDRQLRVKKRLHAPQHRAVVQSPRQRGKKRRRNYEAKRFRGQQFGGEVEMRGAGRVTRLLSFVELHRACCLSANFCEGP